MIGHQLILIANTGKVIELQEKKIQVFLVICWRLISSHKKVIMAVEFVTKTKDSLFQGIEAHIKREYNFHIILEH